MTWLFDIFLIYHDIRIYKRYIIDIQVSEKCKLANTVTATKS